MRPLLHSLLQLGQHGSQSLLGAGHLLCCIHAAATAGPIRRCDCLQANHVGVAWDDCVVDQCMQAAYKQNPSKSLLVAVKDLKELSPMACQQQYQCQTNAT